MDHLSLPPLHRLLPTVRIDESVLRHSRPLFYSAKKNHECLGNLSVRFTPNPPDILISALLPSTYTQRPDPQLSSDLVGTEATALATTHVVPLLSKFDDKPPPLRRPTQLTHSVMSLFPPSASCQLSPPIQLHVSLPNVRVNLSDPTDLQTSAIKLVKNSIFILLTTGQTSCDAGMLLSSVKRKASSLKNNASLPVETLEPASFNSSGANVAGVWVRGDDAKVASLSLHALAAAWWTRRNKRLSRVPTQNKTPSGDWYERRIWLVCFHHSSDRITVQSGTLSVCDDQGTHFVASLSDPSATVNFEPKDGLPSTDGSSDHQTSWDGWDSGWVTAPTLNETRQANERYQNASRNPVSSSSTPTTRSGHRDTGDRKSRRFQSPAEPPHPARAVDELREANCRDAISEDSGILNARMKAPNYQRATRFACENIAPNPAAVGIQMGSIDSSMRDLDTPARSPVTQKTTASANQQSVQIMDPPVLEDLDSDGELEEGNNLNMEELCRKYLNLSYNEGVERHVTGESRRN